MTLLKSSEDSFFLPKTGRPDFADLRINCQDGSLMAHRAILAIHSPGLKAALQEHESDDIHVMTFAEYPVEQVKQFLDILYGQIEDEKLREENDLFHSVGCRPLHIRVKTEVFNADELPNYLDYGNQDEEMLDMDELGQEKQKHFKLEDGKAPRLKGHSKMDVEDISFMEPILEIEDGKYAISEEMDLSDSDFGRRKPKKNGINKLKEIRKETKTQVEECVICGKVISRTNSAKRTRRNNDTDTCEDCAKSMLEDNDDDQDDEDFDIDEYGKSFKKEVKMEQKSSGPKERKPRRKDIKCEKCYKVFPTETKFQKHFKKCGKPEIEFVFNMHPDKPIGCPEGSCSFTADSIRKLKGHHRQVHDMRMCSYCGKLVLFINLKAHIVEQHTKEFEYKCDFCAEGFVTRRKLDEHREKVHIRLPTYICDLCGKGLVSKRMLTHHRFEAHYFETHDDKCPHCKQVIRDRKRLSKHKKLCGALHQKLLDASSATPAIAFQ